VYICICKRKDKEDDMKNIFSILRGSPFKDFQLHAAEVKKCIDLLIPFIDCLGLDYEKAKKIGEEISKHEYEADKIKDKIRDSLGKSILLPVKKEFVLDMLSTQDAISDTAEDISALSIIKENFTIPPEIAPYIRIVLKKSIETFDAYKKIIDSLDELLEATFAGPQAQIIRDKIVNVAKLEYETDKAEKIFLSEFFKIEDRLSKSDFMIISEISKSIGDIANISEKAANKIRLIILG